MSINLKKPLLFFDLETTGLNVGKDRIVEIAMLKLYPDGTEQEMTLLLNPGKDEWGNQIIIPDVCIAVHNITNEDVKDKPTFRDKAQEILQFIGDADMAGFNSNKFDLPLLVEEFFRAGIDFDLRNRKFIDVQNIFHKMEPRTLVAAYKYYCHADLTDAHQATADTRATCEVFKSQIKMYEGAIYKDNKTGREIVFENDINMLSSFSSDHRNVDLASHIVLNDKDQEVFNFGKYKGQRVREVFLKEPAYYDWMMKADFPHNTKKVITYIMDEVNFEKIQNKFKQ